jgi:hypothetical protein
MVRLWLSISLRLRRWRGVLRVFRRRVKRRLGLRVSWWLGGTLWLCILWMVRRRVRRRLRVVIVLRLGLRMLWVRHSVGTWSRRLTVGVDMRRGCWARCLRFDSGSSRGVGLHNDRLRGRNFIDRFGMRLRLGLLRRRWFLICIWRPFRGSLRLSSRRAGRTTMRREDVGVLFSCSLILGALYGCNHDVVVVVAIHGGITRVELRASLMVEVVWRTKCWSCWSWMSRRSLRRAVGDEVVAWSGILRSIVLSRGFRSTTVCRVTRLGLGLVVPIAEEIAVPSASEKVALVAVTKEVMSLDMTVTERASLGVTLSHRGQKGQRDGGVDGLHLRLVVILLSSGSPGGTKLY